MMLFVTLAVARPLEPGDHDRLRDVWSPAVSPDGLRVAYEVDSVVTEDDSTTSDLYIVGIDGKGRRQLTFDEGSEGQPSFSPDGTLLAFVAARGDDEAGQLWLLPLDGGEARPLTDLPGGVVDFAWAPDSHHLALVVADPDPEAEAKEDDPPKPWVIDRFYFKEDGSGYLGPQRQHLAVVDVADGTVVELTHGPTDESRPAFSPDGRRIAFVSKRGPDPDRSFDWNVYVMDATADAPAQPITTNPGPDCDPDWGPRPAWSPDGKWIAVVQGGAPERMYYAGVHVVLAPADGSGKVREVTPGLDRNTFEPHFSSDGKTLWFIVEDDGTQRLARAPVDGKKPWEVVTPADVAIEGFDVTSGAPVVVASDTRHPAELFAVGKGGLVPLTAENAGWMADVELGETRRIAFPSKDGTEIHGFVLLPPGPAKGPYPALLELHGGPVMQHDTSFSFENQLIAGHGYAVVLPNPRGSSGRGEAFSMAIWADWGHLDGEDVLAAVDHVVAEGVADPQRLAVGGWSYGAILTDQVIAHDSRFKAAISGAGSGNALAGYGTDMYVREYEAELGPPWKDHEVWLRNSYPLLHADQITTPTLFMCGDRDFNVPLAGSEQLYQALRSLGVPTELVVYPGEAHGIGRPSFVRDRSVRFLAWLDRVARMSAGITAVPGVLAGHWTHADHTGVTALLFPAGARGGVWIPGSATATRELGPLDASQLAADVHGICLSGGSAYGLGAADGVMAVLAERGIGFDHGQGVVPIVPAASLFDLHTSKRRPDAAAGRAAAEAASDAPLAEGRVGAATGARVGRANGNPAPGGIGTWSSRVGAWTVGAVAAVNAAGGVMDGARWVAGQPKPDPGIAATGDWRGQTTLVVVATDAPLDKARCAVLARMASAGMARAIHPAFGPFDGDIVFAVSTSRGAPPDSLALFQLGDAAAAAVERAIVRSVTS